VGKNLHYSIINFIKEQLLKCDKIMSLELIPDDNFYIIQIIRKYPYEKFKIYLSDEYIYTLTDYYNKPSEICKGDFIYIARPEANLSNEIELLEISLQEGIYVGKFGRLLAFMNRTLEDAHKNTMAYIKKLKEENKYKN